MRDRRPQRSIDRHLVPMPQLPLLRPIGIRRRHRTATQVVRLGGIAPHLAEPLELLGHGPAKRLGRGPVLVLRQRVDDHEVAVVEAGLGRELGVVGRQQPRRGRGQAADVMRVLVEPVAGQGHEHHVIIRPIPAGGAGL
ncbi:MAG TPA: hypothetical protein VGH33_19270, partial [Isosphaeraceae bacterium]